ncbi:MAG: hypothetical protein ACI4K9_02590 [Candidatus Fimenecus sp.]
MQVPCRKNSFLGFAYFCEKSQKQSEFTFFRQKNIRPIRELWFTARENLQNATWINTKNGKIEIDTIRQELAPVKSPQKIGKASVAVPRLFLIEGLLEEGV